MDHLALLCNLHADGPLTLQVLRRARISTLEDVRRAPIDRLSELLGSTPALARRFVREAHHLAQRTDDPPAEREWLDVPRAAAAPRASPPAASPPSATAPAPPAHARGRHDPLLLRAGCIAGLDAVLCERLVALGLRTLGALAAAPSTALARTLALPLQRVVDLQAQARHALVPLAAPTPSERPIERVYVLPARPPARATAWSPVPAPDAHAAGGPFA